MDVDSQSTAADREFFGRADLLISLTKALHHVGFPSNVIEEKIGEAAGALGIPLEMLCLPTGILMTLHRTEGPVTYAVRERPGVVNLERMTLLVQAADGLISGALPRNLAQTRIDEVTHAADRWGRSATVGAYVLSAAAFAVFFGGGSKEVLISVLIGLAAGVLAVFMRGRSDTRLFEFAAATCGSAIAAYGDRVFGSFVEWIPVAAGLIILLPGISLIDSVSELSRGHLVSGMARLAGVGVVFLALTFGAVVGISLADLVPDIPRSVESHPLADWWVLPALAAVTVGSMIRFRARPTDWLVILAASALALFAARWGTNLLGVGAGPFVAALILGAAGTVFSGMTGQTPELVIIPGIALLVPGSVGVRSFSSLLSQQTTVGVDAALQMFLIAMALASGLLFSQALLRDRQSESASRS